MFNANTNSHYKTLKGWTKSAEYSRNKLIQQSADDTQTETQPEVKGDGGVYKVKFEGKENWEIMATPPSSGVSEWLYINQNGVPIYFWQKGQDGLTII